jgi:plasmid replication initiation protein
MTEGPQLDLLADALRDAAIKDERALMEFPFFSLEKRPRMEPIVYDDGRVRIEIQPGHRGVATIWDKEILIYLASIINDRLERGLPAERTIRFRAREFLRLSGRGLSDASYKSLEEALERLDGTRVRTSLVGGTSRRDRAGFGWIDGYQIAARELKDGRKVMGHIEVTLNAWTFNMILKGRRLLTITPAYFQLTSSLERRLYELARKHCGQQPEWRIGLPRLAEKVGVAKDRPLRKFKSDLLRIQLRGSLPEYQMGLETGPGGASQAEHMAVVFTPRPAGG